MCRMDVFFGKWLVVKYIWSGEKNCMTSNPHTSDMFGVNLSTIWWQKKCCTVLGVVVVWLCVDLWKLSKYLHRNRKWLDYLVEIYPQRPIISMSLYIIKGWLATDYSSSIRRRTTSTSCCREQHNLRGCCCWGRRVVVTGTDRPTNGKYRVWDRAVDGQQRRGRCCFSPFERNAKDGECHGFFAKLD